VTTRVAATAPEPAALRRRTRPRPGIATTTERRRTTGPARLGDEWLVRRGAIEAALPRIVRRGRL
jgi:hypothetical protein